MSDDLHFMMGQYQASIPSDRSYSPRHMWLRPTVDNVLRVGLTAYAVRLLQDVYFLEWTIDAGMQVEDRHEIGEIESSKAVSSLFTPFAGRIINFNETVLNDPSAINTDNYEAGWLFDMETDSSLLTPQQYVDLLDAGWKKTQGAIKGQMN